MGSRFRGNDGMGLFGLTVVAVALVCGLAHGEPDGPRWYYLGPWVWVDGDDPHWEAPAGTVGLIDLRGASGGVGFFATDTALSDDYTLLGTDLNGPVDEGAWGKTLGVTPPAGSTVLEALVDVLTVQADPTGEARAPPLMPRQDGVLEIWLGGHSQVYARAFEGETDPAWPNIQKRLWETYRTLEAEATARGSKDTTLHQRALAVWQQKYHIADADTLIPPDMESVEPVRPETTYTDNFNRADEDLEASANWTWLTATANTDFNIVSNQVAYGGNTGAFGLYRFEQNLSTDDHFCQFVVTVETATDGGPMVVTRNDASATTTSSTHNYYRANHRNASGDSVIGKTVAGSGSLIATGGAVNPTAPYTIRLVSNGSTHQLFIAGVLQATATDTAIAGHVRTGMRMALDDGTARWDDFVIADIATPVWLVDPTPISTRLQGLAR